MTTYVGGSLDKVHIAELKVAEHLERLARQAIRELSFSAVCTALDISEDRCKEILADRDWPLLRGLRICLLLGALDPRVFEQALDAATDPDLMIRHLPPVPPDIPYTPPPTPATSGPGPVMVTSPPFAAPPSTVPGGMVVTSPPFAPTPTTATTTPPPPIIMSSPPITLYRTDADGLLSHILGYQMKDIETVSFDPPSMPEPELMMSGEVLRPTPPRPTHAWVRLGFSHGGATPGHPYPNEDVSRLVLLLREFRARTGYGPTMRASS